MARALRRPHRKASVPARLISDFFHESNHVVADMSDHRKRLTRAEGLLLGLLARFALRMRPYIGIIPLPAPKQKRD